MTWQHGGEELRRLTLGQGTTRVGGRRGPPAPLL